MTEMYREREVRRSVKEAAALTLGAGIRCRRLSQFMWRAVVVAYFQVWNLCG